VENRYEFWCSPESAEGINRADPAPPAASPKPNKEEPVDRLLPARLGRVLQGGGGAGRVPLGHRTSTVSAPLSFTETKHRLTGSTASCLQHPPGHT